MSAAQHHTPVRGTQLPSHGTRYATASPHVEVAKTDDAGAALRFVQRPAVRWGAGLLVTMAVALGGWYVGNRDDLAGIHEELGERLTDGETRAVVESGIETHAEAADPHPPLSKRLDKMAETQSQIRDSVMKQGATLLGLGETLREIRADIRRIRRTR